MGFDSKFHRAFYKAQLGAGTLLPTAGKVFLSIKDDDKGPMLIEAAACLADMGPQPDRHLWNRGFSC
jgi:carbamoyl-phosphate synthase large subunit